MTKDSAPIQDHHSFAQHEAIVAAIRDRDQEMASKLMLIHLEDVRDKLLKPKG